MKINRIFLTTCFSVLLVVSFLKNPVFAQKPSDIKLAQPKINFYLKPGIDQINYPKKDSARAAKTAAFIYQFISKKLDSVSKPNRSNYIMDSTQRADFDIELTLSLGNHLLGRGKPDFSYLSLSFINKATKNTIPILTSTLKEINGIHEIRLQFMLPILVQSLLIQLENLVVNTNAVINPENDHHYKKQSATIIPQYFTTSTPQLKPVAKTITHFVNNVFAELQTSRMIITSPKEGEKAPLSYQFNYYPNYRSSSQKIYVPTLKYFLVTGHLYQKDKNHLALKIRFKGQNIKLNRFDEPVKREIVFRKDLIERGIYSELAYKVRRNFGRFVMYNY